MYEATGLAIGHVAASVATHCCSPRVPACLPVAALDSFGSSGSDQNADIANTPALSLVHKRRQHPGAHQAGTQRVASLAELACTAPAGKPPVSTACVAAVDAAAVDVEAAEGEEEAQRPSTRSGGRIRRRRRRWEEEEEEEAELAPGEEPGLLVTMLPHPVVQTAPDAAGLDARDGAAAKGAEQPTRASRRQQACKEQQPPQGRGSGRQAGQKRPAASPPAPAVAAPQPKQAGMKRRRVSLTGLPDEATPPPPPAIPDSEDQTISEVSARLWGAFCAAPGECTGVVEHAHRPRMPRCGPIHPRLLSGAQCPEPAGLPATPPR